MPPCSFKVSPQAVVFSQSLKKNQTFPHCFHHRSIFTLSSTCLHHGINTGHSTSLQSPLKSSGAEGQQRTHRRRCSVLCSLCCPRGLVVFGAAVATVTVDVRLGGALLAVEFPWIGRSPSLGSGLPQEGADPLNGVPSWNFTGKIWAQKYLSETLENPLKMPLVNQMINWLHIWIGFTDCYIGVNQSFTRMCLMSDDIKSSQHVNLSNRTFCIPVLLHKYFQTCKTRLCFHHHCALLPHPQERFLTVN